MPGVRRITVCKNPLINDRGAELIAEALKDDLWVKGSNSLNFKILIYVKRKIVSQNIVLIMSPEY